MAVYNAPLNDMRFMLNDVFKAPQFWQNNENLAHVDMETVDMILEEMAKLSKNVLLPINRSGDDQLLLLHHGFFHLNKQIGFFAGIEGYIAQNCVSIA